VSVPIDGIQSRASICPERDDPEHQQQTRTCLLVGEYGDHVLVEQVVESDGLVAVRALAADADAACEDGAAWAALLAEEAFLAAGTLVDGEVSPWPGGWDGDGGEGLLVAAPERCLAAWGTAVSLAAGRREGSLADRAGHRLGVVPRRDCSTVVASRLDVGVRLVVGELGVKLRDPAAQQRHGLGPS
jgi:hypothetical protein